MDADQSPWLTDAFTGPTIAEIATPRQPVPDTILCRELDSLFRADGAADSIVLVGRDGTLSLVNRRFFYQLLVGQFGFGWALYSNRPLSALPIPEPVRVDARSPAAAAGLELLRADISTEDDVLVTGLLAGAATLSVSALFAEVASHHASQAVRFRTLVQHLSDIVAVLTADGVVHYLSPSYQRVTGIAPDSRLGQSIVDTLHPDDRRAFEALFQRALANPSLSLTGELRMQIAAGAYRLFELMLTNLRNDPNVAGVVMTYRDITDRRQLEEKLRHQALHDPLTGLANRTLMVDRIEHALAQMPRSGTQVVLLYVDLDGFKAVNDVCSHAAGDELLIAVGMAMATQLRPSDTLSRLGGDEFAVLLEGIESPPEAMAIAARLHRCLDHAFTVQGRSLQVRASIGVAVADHSNVAADDLLRWADLAMYQAKAEGKNRTVLWEPHLRELVLTDQKLAVELHHAVQSGQLVVHYQPIVSVATGRIHGAEALVRWEHPEHGLLAPSRFIPIAERTGAIAELTAFVLRRACQQARQWKELNSHDRLFVSVNISGPELTRPGLSEEIRALLDECNLPSELLQLEITETALVSLEDAGRALSELKQLGVKVAIDDFGTGYSSLSYVHQLPIDIIKIDKSFVSMLRMGQDHELVRGLITLAHSLGLTVVAEGIEDPIEHAALESMGCDYAQGYLFAPPGPPEAIIKRLHYASPRRH